MKYLAFLLFLFPPQAIAQKLILSDPIQVADEKQYGKTRPRITTDRSGDPVVLWGNHANRKVYVSRLENQSFSQPEQVNPDGVNAMVANWAGPDLGSYGDTLFVVYHSQPDDVGYCYVHKSVDGGQSFTDSVRVDHPSVDQSRIPSIAVNLDGNPVVGFMKFEGNYIDPQYTVANSFNGGLTFEQDVEASLLAPGEVCDCCQAQVATGEAGQAIVYRNNDDDLRDNWVSISTDDGATFPQTLDVDNSDWIVNSCPASGPDAFYAGDSLYTTWMSAGSGDSRIYIASVHSENGGIGYSGLIQHTPPSGINENFVRADGNGQDIGVVYQAWHQGETDCHLIVSQSGINGFGETLRLGAVQDGAQRYPDIAYHNGVYHIVYDDSEAGHLMYQRAFFGNVGIEENLALGVRMWSPFAGALNIHIKEINDDYNVELLDVTGRPTQSLTTNTILTTMVGVIPGVYFVRIQNNNSTLVRKVMVH